MLHASIFMQKRHFNLTRYAQAASILIATLTLTVLSACSKPAPAPEPIRAVKVLTVGVSGLNLGHEYAGEVRARVESRLGFRVAGKLLKRQAEVAMRVQKGQILAQIDPSDYTLAADAARAQVAAAATNRDLAAADFRRFQTLKDQNFISGAELERRETVLKAAQAQLEQAQAQLAAQGNQARYTTLVADVAGVVTAVEAEAGQVVAAGTPVVRIAQDGARDVVFSVPEDKLATVRVGMVVQVRQLGQTSQVGAAPVALTGAVREIAASADPVTRTFPVKVTLNAAQAPALGSTVYVVPPSLTAAVQAIKLPTSALVQAGGATQVWVVDRASMTVKATPIQIATADGNEAVVAAGLQPGDVVVAAGVHVLSPGQKVSFYKEKGVETPMNNAQAATKNIATGVLQEAASASAAAAAGKK